MKVFTYDDLRKFLMRKLYFNKYRRLANFLKSEISKDPNFNFFDYLYTNRNKIIIKAKNDAELKKKVDDFIKTKFKQMNFTIIDEIEDKIKDMHGDFL